MMNSYFSTGYQCITTPDGHYYQCLVALILVYPFRKICISYKDIWTHFKHKTTFEHPWHYRHPLSLPTSSPPPRTSFMLLLQAIGYTYSCSHKKRASHSEKSLATIPSQLPLYHLVSAPDVCSYQLARYSTPTYQSHNCRLSCTRFLFLCFLHIFNLLCVLILCNLLAILHDHPAICDLYPVFEHPSSFVDQLVINDMLY